MNIYVLVEGEVGEKQVYQKWIPLVNSSLSCVPHISQIERDNFVILSGGGYPQYYGLLSAAIEDVNTYGNIDRLVISVDSEEMTYEEKLEEVSGVVAASACQVEIKIVVQHFCLETWALGNKKFFRPRPRIVKLREYKTYYNVRELDPERLPPYPPEGLNRAQFATKYLRKIVNDKNPSLTYTKRNPRVLLHPSFYGRVRERHEQTGHIKSFSSFLDAFC